MPAYARYHTGLLPETERAASEVLSLPIYPEFEVIKQQGNITYIECDSLPQPEHSESSDDEKRPL